MKEIPLTRGYVALVDDEDYDWLNQWKWFARVRRQTAYAARTVHRRTVQMHTLISGFAITDHIDGDGWNNQRHNLRDGTIGNKWNQRKYRGGANPYKGAYLRRSSGRWQAQIAVSGRRINLGTFDTQEEAALAYDAAARTHFGEFAALNFPAPGERGCLVSASEPGS